MAETTDTHVILSLGAGATSDNRTERADSLRAAPSIIRSPLDINAAGCTHGRNHVFTNCASS